MSSIRLTTAIIFLSIGLVTSDAYQEGSPTNAGFYFSHCDPASWVEPELSLKDVNNTKSVQLPNFLHGNFTIVVNVASFCRLTFGYLEMNTLLDSFPDLQILAFPCDQFGHQEPGTSGTEILNTMRYVRPGNNYQPHKRIFIAKKGDVNGHDENSVYTHLKASCPQPHAAKFQTHESFWDPIYVNDINWNFAMFLLDKKGTPVFRFLPGVSPSLLADVITLLRNGETWGPKLFDAVENIEADMFAKEVNNHDDYDDSAEPENGESALEITED